MKHPEMILLMMNGRDTNYLCQMSWDRDLVANLNLPNHVSSGLCRAAIRILGFCQEPGSVPAEATSMA